jgi:hypothetical protein
MHLGNPDVRVEERVHRLMVVDDEQRPLGVLAAMDFVTLFAEGQLGSRD